MSDDLRATLAALNRQCAADLRVAADALEARTKELIDGFLEASNVAKQAAEIALTLLDDPSSVSPEGRAAVESGMRQLANDVERRNSIEAARREFHEYAETLRQLAARLEA